jgi:hypothetical protein
MARRQQYETRDPVVTTRDPEPVARQPEERSFDHVPIVRVVRPACPKCGATVWRVGGTTRPNLPTGEMFRYRKCAHCGQPQYHAAQMTADERRQYAAT